MFLFSLAFILSLLGSLPINMITLTIVLHAVNKGKKAAVQMALGASMPQFFYTYLALYAFDYFHNNNSLDQQLQAIAAVIFLGLSIYFFWEKAEQQHLDESIKSPAKHFSFMRGLIISTLNVLVIPFWIFMVILLGSYDVFISGSGSILSFSLGAALGALGAFAGYAKLGVFITNKLGRIMRYTNKIAAIVFLLLGVYQVYHLV